MKAVSSALIMAGMFVAHAVAIPANVPRPEYATTITTTIGGKPTTITATIDPFPTSGTPAVVTLHQDYVTTETRTFGGHTTTLTLTVDAPVTETITTTIDGQPTTLTTTIFPFGSPTPLPR
ncbi:hypothetical protein C8T65DRAFT_746007 [Cerioporus squamosus]|nr:hypothetical protein C8T65DRAFT_746007 [Cerioporus squamosus]